MKKKKIFKKVLVGILALVLAVLVYASNFLVTFGIARKGEGGNRKAASEEKKIEKKKDDIYYINKKKYDNETEELKKTVKISTEEIKTKDNLKLKVNFINNEKSNNWVLLIHGYRSSHNGMMNFATQYYKKGFNVVTPDLRASGESEGNYIGMGILDSEDMKIIINKIIEKDPKSKIVIHGVSMGAATTMNLSNQNLPNNVKIFIEDCGYTTVWDIFSQELGYRFNLPEFPILHVSSLISRIRAGYGFKDISTIDRVKESKLPMLFIHCKKDDFIPFEMMEKLYNAKEQGIKDKIISENADHGNAMYFMGDEYWQKTFDFINKNINN